MYIYLCVCIPVCLQRPEEGIEASGAGVTGSCELPSIARCLELNPHHLGEQHMLLTPESSLQLLKCLLIYIIASDCDLLVVKTLPYLFLLACLQMPLQILRNESSIVALTDFAN